MGISFTEEERCSGALRVRQSGDVPGTPPAADMTGRSLLFMIVDDAPARAENLKELIEFMDVPQVQVVAADNWPADVGDRRLAAVFLSDTLDQDKLRKVISDVGELDPNVSIVLVNHTQSDT
ncbi:MAG: hypothetical protein WD672_04100 [Woeseia sp.]